jgi:hypothetical protein
MTDQPTLKVFFCDDAAKPVSAACDLSGALAAVAAAGGAASAGKGAQPDMTGAFSSALEEVFQVKIADILLASWGKMATLQEALKSTRADTDSVVFVPMVDHKLTSSHTPYVDVLYGGKKMAQVAFDIALALQLKGIELEVRHGRLHGLRAGACQGEGTFSFAGKR